MTASSFSVTLIIVSSSVTLMTIDALIHHPGILSSASSHSSYKGVHFNTNGAMVLSNIKLLVSVYAKFVVVVVVVVTDSIAFSCYLYPIRSIYILITD